MSIAGFPCLRRRVFLKLYEYMHFGATYPDAPMPTTTIPQSACERRREGHSRGPLTGPWQHLPAGRPTRAAYSGLS